MNFTIWLLEKIIILMGVCSLVGKIIDDFG